jgi:hypothetical protein
LDKSRRNSSLILGALGVIWKINDLHEREDLDGLSHALIHQFVLALTNSDNFLSLMAGSLATSCCSQPRWPAP